MYKVNISVLEALKKQLVQSNKTLSGLKPTPEITKVIKGNTKQIKLIQDEYNIN